MFDKFLDTPLMFLVIIKGNHTESTPLNKTQVLMKIMNMDIWLIGTLNQEIFILESNFQKKDSS